MIVRCIRALYIMIKGWKCVIKNLKFPISLTFRRWVDTLPPHVCCLVNKPITIMHEQQTQLPTQNQFKLLIKTSASKLKFKLSKSRALSTNTIQTIILTELQNLAALPNDSRGFERGLDILKMKLATLVRSDRVADVWEDLTGELAILESSIHLLPAMIEHQRTLQKERLDKLKSEATLKNPKPTGKGWHLFGFGFTTYEPVEVPMDEPKDNSEAKKENLEPIDRLSKVIRNIVIAQEYLGDDIKELKKLAVSLSYCIDKEYLLQHAPKDNKPEDDINLDLEDKIYNEIVRKLRGDDENKVINEYMKELANVYKVDLYNEGKYPSDENDDETKEVHGLDNKTIENKSKKAFKQPLSDLDALKQRFEALKKL